MTVRTAVDEKDLGPEEAQKLRRLVEEADFFNLSGKMMARSSRPDRFQYGLRLKEKGREHTVTVSEEGLPAKLKPLVNWLMEKSRQARKGKGSP